MRDCGEGGSKRLEGGGPWEGGRVSGEGWKGVWRREASRARRSRGERGGDEDEQGGEQSVGWAGCLCASL